MKKIAFAALFAIMTAASFTSCGNGTPKADLKDDIDTLSYAIGMAQSDGLKQYLSERLGIDTAYIDDFIKGLNEGATAGDDKKKAAYYAGIQIGQQLGGQMRQGINYELFGNDSTQTISMKNLLAGFVAGVTEKNQKMTLPEAQKFTQTMIDQIKNKNVEKQWGAYKKQNEAWLAANAKKPGVVSLAGGLQYKILTEGNGAIPTDTATVMVMYEGKTIDGNVFDSNMTAKEPATFPIHSVIAGWTEILKHMPVGSTWEVYIPASMGYGAQQQGQAIKPFSTLIFTIKLLGIK